MNTIRLKWLHASHDALSRISYTSLMPVFYMQPLQPIKTIIYTALKIKQCAGLNTLLTIIINDCNTSCVFSKGSHRRGTDESHRELLIWFIGNGVIDDWYGGTQRLKVVINWYW